MDFFQNRNLFGIFENFQIVCIFENLNTFLRRKLRISIGRNKDASAAIVDSQSVKTVERGALSAMMQARKSREENVIYWLTLKDF